MRVLVTGAAGLIGHEIALQLLQDGDEVVAVDDLRKGGQDDLRRMTAEFPKFSVVHADLAEPGWEADAPGPFDAVIHLAAIVGVAYVEEHPYETARTNLLSTIRVLDHAVATGAGAFAFASSSENYACGVTRGWVDLPTSEDVPLVIDDIALPRWSYAASKIAGESLVHGAAHASGIRPLVLRFHNVYGPRMGPTHVIPALLQRCAAGEDPFRLYGSDQTRSFLYISDAARAVRTVLAEGDGGTWNIGSDDEVVIAELARRIFDVTGFHPSVDALPAPAGSVARRVPDIGKLRGIGYAAQVPLDEGLRRCWERWR